MPTAKPSKEPTIAYYDAHAKDYSEATSGLDLTDLYHRFLDKLAPGAHILDAGSGSGRDAKAFLGLGFRVTMIDASAELAKMASQVAGQECLVMPFQKMNFDAEFNGIWACASLLHIPKLQMSSVLKKFNQALKTRGIFYISLKSGEGERVAEDGRFFNNYTHETFLSEIQCVPSLKEISFWESEDVVRRPNSSPWLNFIFTKGD